MVYWDAEILKDTGPKFQSIHKKVALQLLTQLHDLLHESIFLM
jgi:hypothetical protein